MNLIDIAIKRPTADIYAGSSAPVLLTIVLEEIICVQGSRIIA